MVAAIAAVIAVLFALPTPECEPLPEPTVEQAAGTEGVAGVVERLTLAENPLPWGASVSIATEVWGGIIVERWKVSARRMTACPSDPATPAGATQLDFRGAEAEWGELNSRIHYPGEVPEPARVVLASEFGEPIGLAVSGTDRTMAWVRVAGSEMLAILGAVVGLAVWRARAVRRRRLDRHLF
jgi:hypothetical protein